MRNANEQREVVLGVWPPTNRVFFFPLFLFLDFSKPKEGRPYGRFMRLAVEDNLYDIQYEYVIDLIEKND